MAFLFANSTNQLLMCLWESVCVYCCSCVWYCYTIV